MWEMIPPIVKALLGAGLLGLIGTLATIYSATRKNQSDMEIALRRLENEEEAAFRAREEALRQRETALYQKQIDELKAENERLVKEQIVREAAQRAREEEERQRHGRRH